MPALLRHVRPGLVTLQVAGLILGLLWLVLLPPAHGEILLVPLNTAAAKAILPAALAGDARLVGRGPTAGSLVVFGDLRRLAAATADARVLLLAAPSVGCTTFAQG